MIFHSYVSLPEGIDHIIVEPFSHFWLVSGVVLQIWHILVSQGISRIPIPRHARTHKTSASQQNARWVLDFLMLGAWRSFIFGRLDYQQKLFLCWNGQAGQASHTSCVSRVLLTHKWTWSFQNVQPCFLPRTKEAGLHPSHCRCRSTSDFGHLQTFSWLVQTVGCCCIQSVPKNTFFIQVWPLVAGDLLIFLQISV